MIGEIIPVGEHYGRWLYVTRVTNYHVYGRVWSSLRGRWSKAEVYYPVDSIGKTKPICLRPAAPQDTHAQETATTT